MPNAKGWYTKAEMEETGLPCYIKQSDRWTATPYSFGVLLTKSRCKELGVPILLDGAEKPAAFKYLAAAGTGTGDKRHRYVPLYDRTDAWRKIEMTLYPGETMGE